MPSSPFNFFRELEHAGKVLQASGSLNDFFGSLQHMLGGGPRVSVQELEDKVRVLVEAPGLTRSNRKKWSYRIQDQVLFIKGEMMVEQAVGHAQGEDDNERHEEQFTRGVPLPVAVRSRPKSVQYENGVVTLLFQKRNGRPNEPWHDLYWDR